LKTPLLEQLPLTQQDRLEFIDFSLEFYGKVSRQWLSRCLQLATASCTRDITLYRQFASENLEMRHQDKAFYRTDKFKALFVHKPKKTLAKLERYSPVLFSATPAAVLSSDVIIDNSLLYPPMDVTAMVNRAIVSRSAVQINYESLRVGAICTDLIPFAIFHGYRGWYVRAYDLSSAQFSDFSLSRIQSVAPSAEPVSVTDIAPDSQWNTIVNLLLEPHPSVSNKRAIEMMYRMENGCLTIVTNAVIARHLLRRENVAVSNNDVFLPESLLSLKSGLSFNPILEEL
jgi:hypothetical protein